MSVPASSERFIASARSAAADEVFLDLEDAVAAGAKVPARAAASAALNSGDWAPPTVGVRINDTSTSWAFEDVLAVVCARLDVIVLPKVRSVRDVIWLDVLLAQVEAARGLPAGRIGIEAQIEDAAGLSRVEEIAAASPRLESLVFGPADFTASLGTRSLDIGGSTVFDYALTRILVAARAHGLQAIDGPYLKVRDVDGFRRAAASVAALGYDGKWVLHPAQVAAANIAFAPTPEEVERATTLLSAYGRATDVDRRGAVMHGDDMIDEASRKMALSVLARAGVTSA
jgi:citrate lyase subunit beta / citryl-CoA lyase